MTLYKYLTSERSDILATDHIRYTQPVYLNDPFEIRPDLSDLLTEKLLFRWATLQMLGKSIKEVVDKLPFAQRWLGWIFATLFLLFRLRNMRTMIASFMAKVRNDAPAIIEKQFRRELGVLSLTSSPDNLLMWSHYAMNHTGFVLAVDEKHAVFNEQRSENDELRRLRKVVYKNRKPRLNMGNLDQAGVNMLLTKSKAWEHEDEWRIIKTIGDASATGRTQAAEVFLFPLPPEAIEGVIFGAHIPEEERTRITLLIHNRPELDHIWLKQAEISEREFALKFFRLPGYVGRYHEPKGEFRYHDVPEDRWQEIANTFNAVASMAFKQPLDLSRMKWVHVTADVTKTVKELTQLPFAGDKDGHVIGLSQIDDVDVVVFLAEHLFLKDGAATEDEAKHNLHVIHRELVHVHNVTVRFHALGEKALTERKPGTAGYLEPVAVNVWNEYAVARLSAASFPKSEIFGISRALMDINKSCAAAVAQAIADYKKHGNLDQLMMLSAVQIQNLLCEMAKVQGYADGYPDQQLSDLMNRSLDAFLGYEYRDTLRDLRKALKRMYLYYPVWEDGTIYDDLMFVVRMLALQWNLPMRNLGKRMHVAIN